MNCGHEDCDDADGNGIARHDCGTGASGRYISLKLTENHSENHESVITITKV